MFQDLGTEDFFRLRLDMMLDLRSPLVVLSSHMPWQQIEASVAHLFARKVKDGKRLSDLDLFGQGIQTLPKKSNAGRPRVPLRIMISLLYLKHAFNESDEGVVDRWAETPSWQFFSGSAYFEQRHPCDATTLVKFRKMLGDEGVEELLAQTINAAVNMKLIKPETLKTVVVDSTVQEKAIAHPTDSKLLETARTKLVVAAKDAGIDLKQTYAKEGKRLAHKIGRYAHARQFKRMRKAIKRQCTLVGRLKRDIERKSLVLTEVSAAVMQGLNESLSKTDTLLNQTKRMKRKDGTPKLYSWHAPEVECINKGKSRRPYEFGCKVSIASTLKGNLIVGAKAFHGNPYDGHTLNPQLEQVTILMQDNNVKPHTVFVDLGYRGVDGDNQGMNIIHRGKSKSISEEERKLLKRRQAIEPIIGHVKDDHRMRRCHLKGKMGDRLHAVLCAAGFNIKWLLRMIAKKGVTFLRFVFLRLKEIGLAGVYGLSWAGFAARLISAVKSELGRAPHEAVLPSASGLATT